MKFESIACEVKEASLKLAAIDADTKNKALTHIAQALKNRSKEIMDANKEDIERSQKENLAAPLLKRLKFDEAKLDDVISGINALINMEDPVGKVLFTT